jgi:hypothetical protein
MGKLFRTDEICINLNLASSSYLLGRPRNHPDIKNLFGSSGKVLIKNLSAISRLFHG